MLWVHFGWVPIVFLFLIPFPWVEAFMGRRLPFAQHRRSASRSSPSLATSKGKGPALCAVQFPQGDIEKTCGPPELILGLLIDTPNEFLLKMKAIAKAHPNRSAPSEELLDIFNKVSPRVDSYMVGDWLWSLSYFGLKAGNPKHQQLIHAAFDKLCTSRGLSGRIIGTGLNGLHRLEVNLAKQSAEHRQGLANAIMLMSPSSNPVHITASNLLNALLKLDVKWNDIPESARRLLLASVAINADNVAPLASSVTTHSLGCLGFKPTDFSLIHKLALKGMHVMGSGLTVQICKQNIMTLVGLEKMCISLPSLPDEVCAHVYNCLLTTMPAMNALEVSSAVRAMGMMNAHWAPWGHGSDWSEEFKATMLAAIVEHLRRMERRKVPFFLFCTLLGLSKARAGWSTLPTVFTEAVVGALDCGFVREATSADMDNMLGVLRSLGSMGAQWGHFSKQFQQDICQNIIDQHHRSYYTSQGVSTILFGLGGLQAQLDDLSKEFIRAIADILRTIVEHSVSCNDLFFILRGLVQMGAKHGTMTKELEDSVMNIIGHRAIFTPASIGSTVYLLGQMDMKLETLPGFVVRALERGIRYHSQLPDQRLANVFEGLGQMGAKWSALDEGVKRKLFESLTSPIAFTAPQQNPNHITAVIKGLGIMGVHWQDNGLPRSALQDAVRRVGADLSEEHWRDIKHGLNLMGVAWDELPLVG